MTVQGIDVSAFQGNFDWKAHQDISFAGIRATSWPAAGGFTADPELKLNANTTWELFDGRIPRIYYHEARPAYSDPDMQALAFLHITGHHLVSGDVLGCPMGDNGGNGTMRPAQIADWFGEFMHQLRLLTDRQHKVMAYTNVSWAQAGNCAGLQGWPLWLADYNPAPAVPRPWAEYDIWQPAPGAVDRDVWHGTQAQLLDFAGMPAWRR